VCSLCFVLKIVAHKTEMEFVNKHIRDTSISDTPCELPPYACSLFYLTVVVCYFPPLFVRVSGMRMGYVNTISEQTGSDNQQMSHAIINVQHSFTLVCLRSSIHLDTLGLRLFNA
jgi:hypothetical protein